MYRIGMSTIQKQKTPLAIAVRQVIKSQKKQTFDIAELYVELARQYRRGDKQALYHQIRAVVHHLKKAGKLKKLDPKGHSGKYKQVAAL